MADALSRIGAGRQKFCLGRWLAIRAFAEDPEIVPRTPAARKRQAAFRAAKREVEAKTTNAIELEDRGESIPEFLDHLVASVENGGRRLQGHARALRTEVAAFKNTPADPFDEIFAVAHQVAASFYEDAGQAVPEARCEPSLDPYADPPYPNFPAVDGHVDARSSGTIVAVLDLTGRQFWRDEMCVLTYATLHELVVHAFASEIGRDSTDSFAEGWMDFLAFGLHERLCGGELALAAALAGPLPPADQHLEAEGLHIARGRASPLAKAGRAAAKEAQGALAAEFGKQRGVAAMRAFSAALNRSDLPPDSRSEACEAIGRAVRSGDSRPWVEAAKAVHEASSAGEKRELAVDFALALGGSP